MKLYEKTIRKVEDLTGKYVTKGYITNERKVHIIKSHGDPIKENKRGQIAVIKDDFKYIPFIINHYDIMEMTFDNVGRKRGIKFWTKINGHRYVCVCLIDKNDKLFVTTMFIKP